MKFDSTPFQEVGCNRLDEVATYLLIPTGSMFCSI